MKVLTLANTGKLIIGKLSEFIGILTANCWRAAQRNYFELDFDFEFCKKLQKPGPFFAKARTNFAKVKVKIKK